MVSKLRKSPTMTNKLTLVHILKHPEKRLRFKNVRIWSGEHKAWWGANYCGYTVDIQSAGVYTMENAWNKTKHCCKKKKIVYYETKDIPTTQN